MVEWCKSGVACSSGLGGVHLMGLLLKARCKGSLLPNIMPFLILPLNIGEPLGPLEEVVPIESSLTDWPLQLSFLCRYLTPGRRKKNFDVLAKN